MSQKCQCTHDREDHGFYFIDGACHNTACNCKRYNPAPQEAPEMKETAMHALESLTPGGSEFYQDVARCKEWIKDRIDHNWEMAKKARKETNELEAAADKMAEAGWKALFLLRDIQRDEKADGRTLTGRFEIAVSDLQAALSEYQKAVGK